MLLNFAPVYHTLSLCSFIDNVDTDEYSFNAPATLGTGTLPVFASSAAEFWNKIDSRGETYQLKNLIK
jgi:hypothetical protein